MVCPADFDFPFDDITHSYEDVASILHGVRLPLLRNHDFCGIRRALFSYTSLSSLRDRLWKGRSSTPTYFPLIVNLFIDVLH